MDYFTETERRFEAAKARLLAAQQEKLEASAEFLAARTVLSGTLETLWPGLCPCGKMEYKENVSAEKDVSINWV